VIRRIGPGEILPVHGGAGSVGSFAIQFANQGFLAELR